ncbi:MAG: TonB-dependent receptor [Bacteroidetes bacterium]|nr:TonB-dependent receptor [Bacteroidota bacterium]MBL0140182.1 TonB-dependent receptor [Bacteroidota bacterium]
MKNLISTTFLIILLSGFVKGQNLTQTVRGTIIDADSKLPLFGVVIQLSNDRSIGTVTDINGEFRLEKMQVGRISLLLSYLGYESKTISDIEVNSGKEKVLELSMQESLLKLKEVEIKAIKNKGEALNEMSLISTRSISAEETKRYAGGLDDPSKILSNYAGVTASQNGQNDIIVRGNSPKYVQWRLDGVEITNPTHFGDQNAVNGGVSALNNSLLGTSDFSTGAFTPEYGDVLSGVYDVKFRTGNNEKHETSIGVGIQGTDLTLEGPFKKGYGGSYLINYRYSTISLLNKLHAIKVDGDLNYQDGAFKIVLPTKKMGVFSMFGLAGMSDASMTDVRADMISTPNNGTISAELTEDYDKSNYLSNYGINHTMPLSDKSFLKTTLSYSNEGISEDIFKIKTTKLYDDQGGFLTDSIGGRIQDYKSRIKNSAYRAAVTYNNKLDAKNTLQVGAKYALLGYDNALSRMPNNSNELFTVADFTENINTISSFVSWKHRLKENLTIVAGVHNMNVLYNNKSTVEPRLQLDWKINSSSDLNAGYGKHSTMESVHNYFTKVKQADGSVLEPNKNLGLLKADHFVLGYEKRFGENIRLKAEAYYQSLYNLPVENLNTSSYATINEGIEFNYVDLVNKGTGKNYGIELTLERFFNKSYYYLINASLYNSKYKAMDGVERNTQYNGNYLVNVLIGKEFANRGKKKNQTLNVNAKVFFGGGKRYIPLLRDANGNLAVDPANNKFWDNEKAYEKKFEDIYQVNISASYKWNKQKVTHELFLTINNITDANGKLSEYYDEKVPGNVGNVRQFGMFPNLMYRLYF